MKKLFYLLLVLIPFSSRSQIQDSLATAIMEQGLNLLVIEPGEDPNGAQGRPCGSAVVNINSCCHVYQVICGGEVKWQSEPFCKSLCHFTVFKFILVDAIAIPTPQNPLTKNIPFDMSILIDKESITEEEVRELREKYANFYFEVEDNLLIETDGGYLLLKAGNYTITGGEMAVRVFYTTN